MSGRADQPEPSAAYLDAIRRAFGFARAMRHGCGPADFIVGISEGGGPAATALGGHGGRPGGRSLRDITADDEPQGAGRNGKGYLHMQAQQAAMTLAAELGQPAGAEHLLVAFIDQGTLEVLLTMARADLDPAEVRQEVLTAIGAPAGLPPLPMPPLTPAGTLDRQPLGITDLDARAWRVLRWRQDHLPLHRVRHAGDWDALLHLERAAAWRLAERLHLADDQSYSLVYQHDSEVEARLSQERPELASRRGSARAVRPRRGPLRVTAGWRAWFGNRWITVRDRLFQIRTIRDYRGCPTP